ncbi:N-acetylmuramoyl-L-alanine amidase [Flavobacterium enshiense DK69]|uniref:N-acetylmuramoyl-L-alanine amidase n=1 Tax=Flavobacterium enshiense DK69 TaxID=1107311 RepID=V6SAL0_9FLAO|nr:N-acetylmuramoyl-L-alanine amidase [Flavobacterium enshiense]ESU21460.1 N-acetylmuramoyl-L-alanine amidase [Flavobacterium enshiense DK69]KGO97037.1 hypothetical protein Q767_00060 [Flavobacterium enshiense DK69]
MKKSLKLIVLFLSISSLFSFTSNDSKIRVVIDAGHGGSDTGATNIDLKEKDLCLSIANKIKALNKDKNIELFFTREGDESVSLSDRVKEINDLNPDLVISLHTNSSKNNATNGVEVFVPKDLPNSVKSRELAAKFLEVLTNKTGLNQSGVKTASLFILKNSNCPVFVAELGYISNTKDKTFVISEENQNKIALAVLDFISQIK